MSRMDKLKPHRDVLSLWDGPTALARDIGLPPVVVRQWFLRGRIPAHRWLDVCNAARLAGIELSVERLARLVSERAAA
jgi:hypothetical protein